MKDKEFNKKKYIVISIVIVIAAIVIIAFSSYALWQINKSQKDENLLTVGSNSCMKVTFINDNTINLNNTFPKTDAEGMNTNPLEFTIKNECGIAMEFEVHLEVLNTSTMSKEYIKVSFNNETPKIVSQFANADTSLENASEAFNLKWDIIMAGEEIPYNFRQWMDENTPTAAADTEYNTKIVVVSKAYNTIKNFTYTGGVQTFTAPYTGTYKIELWGAQGGGINTNYEGKGAYTKGEIKLNEGQGFYVYVGGTGAKGSYGTGTTNYGAGGAGGFNGGGAGGRGGGNATYPATGYIGGYGGGGATDIRTVWSAEVQTAASRYSRIMVAGGGGGSSGNGGYVNGYTGTTNYDSSRGQAGGINSYSGAVDYNITSHDTNLANLRGTGGTQSTGHGLLYGGAGGATTNSSGLCAGNSGGGGGYFGGKGASSSSSGACFITGGGGGSSFISGHYGCNSFNASGTLTGQANHYSGHIFTNTMMIDGAGYRWTNVKGALTSMPNPNGGNYASGAGHIGHGYARFTLIAK